MPERVRGESSEERQLLFRSSGALGALPESRALLTHIVETS